MSRIIRLISASFVVALAACSGSSGPYGSNDQNPPPPPPPPPGNTVNATPSEVFTPGSLTVNAGQTVTFAFGSLGHNVFFDTPNSPADITGVNANISIQRTFAAAGTYRYHCTIHPQMTGTVVVQ